MLQNMAQMNLQITPEFEANLQRLMRARKIKSRSQAVRLAVEEAANAEERKVTWAELQGILRPAIDAGLRMPTDDEIWADAPLPDA